MRRKALQLTPGPRRRRRPLTDPDRLLGAKTARTLQDLAAIRADLFCEYLFLGSHLPPPDELHEPTAGALALLHKYWQDRRRLPLIREPRRKPDLEAPPEPEPAAAEPDSVARSVSDLSHEP